VRGRGGATQGEWFIPKDKSSLNFTKIQKEKLPILGQGKTRI
jgi:hypothetical protein